MTDAALDMRGLGDNRPPADANPIRERLGEDHDALLARRDELLEAANRCPVAVEDEDTAGRVGDFIKQLHAAIKNAEGSRVSEKEPYLDGGRQVDGFFKAIADPLLKAKKEIEGRLNTFLRAKAEAERRARDEEERKAREAAEAAEREAQAKAQALESQTDLDNAIEAETVAQQAQADAAQASKDADANAAELSRTRGDYGSVASLRTYMDFKDLDRGKLDLEALRMYLPMDALEKAVRGFIKAGGRDLAGVTIFENTKAQVR